MKFAAELFSQWSLWVSQLQQVEVPSSLASVGRIVPSVSPGVPVTSFSFC